MSRFVFGPNLGFYSSWKHKDHIEGKYAKLCINLVYTMYNEKSNGLIHEW